MSLIEVSFGIASMPKRFLKESLRRWFVGPFLKGQQRRVFERENMAKAAINVSAIEQQFPVR